MSTDLWLIRHGRTAQETRGRCYGSLDVALAADWAAEFQAVAASLPKMSAVYSSPRVRSLETARIICDYPVVIDDLAELNFGEFEGRSYDEIAASDPDRYAQWMSAPTEVEFPGGESFSDMRKRVLQRAHDLRLKHEGETFAIVAHGGVNRILLAEALQVPHHEIFRISQKFGAVNLIRYYEGYSTVELMNGFYR